MDVKKFNFHNSHEERVEGRKALDEVPMITEEEIVEDETAETEPNIFSEMIEDLDLTPEEYMEKHGLAELKDNDVEAAVLEAFGELVHDSECDELIDLYADEDLGLREKLEIAANEYEEVPAEEIDEAHEEAIEYDEEIKGEDSEYELEEQVKQTSANWDDKIEQAKFLIEEIGEEEVWNRVRAIKDKDNMTPEESIVMMASFELSWGNRPDKADDEKAEDSYNRVADGLSNKKK